jgi:hypothetical protein
MSSGLQGLRIIVDFTGFLLLPNPLQRPPVRPANRSAAWQQNQPSPPTSPSAMQRDRHLEQLAAAEASMAVLEKVE